MPRLFPRLAFPALSLSRKGSRAQIGGRGLLVGRPALVACLLLFLALAGWAGTATWLLLFRDDLLTRLALRQQRIELAYEDQIAALRRRFDVVTSRQYLDQDGIETRIAALQARQAELEQRQGDVDAFRAKADALGLPVSPAARPAPMAAPVAAKAAPTKPIPLEGGTTLRERLGTVRATTPLERLSRTERSLRAVEARQHQVLAGLLAASGRRLDRYVGIVSEVGLSTDALLPKEMAAANADAVGGPLVAWPDPDASAADFTNLASGLRETMALTERFSRFVAALPLATPSEGSEETSPFGVRLDPFTRTPALHTGADFRASYGSPVRATGPGRIISAGYNGGYGNMVEIDHGNGITTRYAHLAAVTVSEGDAVATGDIVGRTGSTGRSTGAHIHYETRIDGEAVDPQRFITAGLRWRQRDLAAR